MEALHVLITAVGSIASIVVLPLVAYIMRVRKDEFDRISEKLERHLEWHSQRGDSHAAS